jgi:3',5'-cyclic AMP phosphodiesterase CpdA
VSPSSPPDAATALPESKSKPFRVAHISDLHVLDLAGTRWQQWFSKRMTGAINLAGMRRNAHPLHVAEQLARRLAEDDIDHVIITGDVTNLALDSEFRRAMQIVELIGPPSYVTIIPGNHDMYTRGALRHHRFERWFGAYLVDDADLHHSAVTKGRLHYPFVRAPAPHVRIYGLSSAIPTPPFLAFGHVGRPQLDRLRALVAEEPPEVRVRIALVHHNLHHRLGLAEYVASLADRKAFTTVMHAISASVVLHGHTHHPHQGHLPGRKREREALEAHVQQEELRLTDAIEAAEIAAMGPDIPVMGCGSSTWTKKGQDRARFNVLEIDDQRLERVVSYRFSSDRGVFEPEHEDLLAKAFANAIAL